MRPICKTLLLFTLFCLPSASVSAEVLKNNSLSSPARQKELASVATIPTRQIDTLSAKLKDLKKELFENEAAGKKNIPAHQILTEAEWLNRESQDYLRLAERIEALRKAIDDPANLTAKDEQSPIDGAWGKWYTEWFFKLIATHEQLSALAESGEQPKYPLRFLDKINSPDLLKEHLEKLLISNPEVDGIKHRRELNETLSVLVRMIIRDKRNVYNFHSGLRQALLDFLEEARDPKTRYWCDRYATKYSPRCIINLSTTFHIISYLNGNITDWPKVIETTLSIKDKAWPSGWLAPCGYVNHHNMDVVELFRLGWVYADKQQQEAIRKEIKKMLTWCLNNSFQQDGSFKLIEDEDDNIETSVYYGTSFLVRIGFFNKKNRFWTNEDFSESNLIRQKIENFIKSHMESGSEGGLYYSSTLEELRMK